MMGALSLAFVIFVWTRTDAFISFFGWLLAPKNILYVGDFKKDPLSKSIDYPIWLYVKKPSFFTKLISCPLCLSFWLSLIFLRGTIIEKLSGAFIALVAFGILDWLYKHQRYIRRSKKQTNEPVAPAPPEEPAAPVAPVEPITPEPEPEPLIINDYKEFHSFAKTHNLSQFNERVKVFVELMDKIPSLCNCVHGFLYGDAKDLYGRNLPLIQAENPELFDKAKEITKRKIIVFKEGDNLLLQV